MDLLHALEASDPAGASEEFGKEMERGRDVWEIHLSLFPVVQRVLNPPFVNAHLPKMYSICRDLAPYLKREEVPALVALEINEYARKPLMEKLPRRSPLAFAVAFRDIESAIREKDWEKTTTLMAAFHTRMGAKELSSRLLLLGSGYLEESLGHSVSSAAFLLLEMMERSDQDPWPTLATLSDFFCRAQFHTTPPLRRSAESPEEEALYQQMLRATSGQGLVNMHHTITRYALERTRSLFSSEEYRHMSAVWATFMDRKEEEQEKTIGSSLGNQGMGPGNRTDGYGEMTGRNGSMIDYSRFYEVFSRQKPESMLSALGAMVESKEGRRELSRFLIKAVCDQYQGRYDPHFLTGLGSALRMVDRYWNQPPIALNALFQYLDFYFDNLKLRKS